MLMRTGTDVAKGKIATPSVSHASGFRRAVAMMLKV